MGLSAGGLSAGGDAITYLYGILYKPRFLRYVDANDAKNFKSSAITIL